MCSNTKSGMVAMQSVSASKAFSAAMRRVSSVKRIKWPGLCAVVKKRFRGVQRVIAGVMNKGKKGRVVRVLDVDGHGHVDDTREHYSAEQGHKSGMFDDPVAKRLGVHNLRFGVRDKEFAFHLGGVLCEKVRECSAGGVNLNPVDLDFNSISLDCISATSIGTNFGRDQGENDIIRKGLFKDLGPEIAVFKGGVHVCDEADAMCVF